MYRIGLEAVGVFIRLISQLILISCRFVVGFLNVLVGPRLPFSSATKRKGKSVEWNQPASQQLFWGLLFLLLLLNIIRRENREDKLVGSDSTILSQRGSRGIGINRVEWSEWSKSKLLKATILFMIGIRDEDGMR